ncbi:MAG: SDR family oxidoreductase [Acidobacteria bacterium]|nr:SDR family oxidoreductase [Acidobacteriota bacterium]
MERVLVAGATGYLGGFVVKELGARGYFTTALVRDRRKLESEGISRGVVIEAEVTQPQSLMGCCRDVDVVFSSVGITRQKDGLTYMDVDFQSNMNLLEEAKRSGVRKFVYVSVLHGRELRRLKICEAKERFVDALAQSGLEYCVVRPTGYFSDMGEFYRMARKGSVFLFGDGKCRMNPISGADLAKVCVDAMQGGASEIAVGGPEVLTYNQIASMACDAVSGRCRVVHLPDGLRRFVLALLRIVTSSRFYGPVEFVLTMLATDMVAPVFGSQRLSEYFRGLKGQSLR